MDNAKTFHGYLILPRQAKLLLQDLGYALYGFHQCLLMDALWFRGNPQIGCITKTQKELAITFQTTQPTVSRLLAKLEGKQYIIRHKGCIRLRYFPLFLADVNKKTHSKDYANLHELYADVDSINAELQEKYTQLHEKRAQNTNQRLYISSKVNLSSSQEDINLNDVDEGIERNAHR